MEKTILPILALAFLTYGCGNAKSNTNEQDATSTNLTEQGQEEEPKKAQSILDLFSEMAINHTSSKQGEYVLSPNISSVERYLKDSKSGITFEKATMVAPAEKNSEVNYQFGGKQQVPNHLIIPIPAGQTAQKGDIILTWWQSGSGMQRAIVTDDTDPKAPEIHYLDLSWDDMVNKKLFTEKINENTFTRINDIWQSGTTVAVKEGSHIKKYVVINTAGNKVLVSGFVKQLTVLDKSECTPLMPVNNIKVGDVVQAPWSSGNFRQATVKEIKAEYGRAVLIFDHDKETEKMIPLGDIATGL